MKTLLRQLIERMETEGGEEWLRLCLTLPSGLEAEEIPTTASGMGPEGSGSSSWMDSASADIVHEDVPPLQVPERRGQEAGGRSNVAAREKRNSKVQRSYSLPVVKSGTAAERSASQGARQKMNDVNVGVRKMKRSRSQSTFFSGRLPMQPNRQDARASSSCSGDMPRRSENDHSSFQSASRGDNDFNSNNEMPLPPAAIQGELGNINMITTLYNSISQLASSLSFLKDMSNASNVQDVSSVWNVTDQLRSDGKSVAADPATNEDHTVQSHITKANVPEICIPCQSSPLGFHLTTEVNDKVRKRINRRIEKFMSLGFLEYLLDMRI